MSLNEKKTAISMVGFCPENLKMTANHRHAATGGTTTTATVDASTGKPLSGVPSEFFKGAYVHFVKDTTTTALQRVSVKVDSFTIAGSVATFTFAQALSVAVQATDSFVVFWPLRASGFSSNPRNEPLEQDYHRNSLDPLPMLKGNPQYDGSFELQVPGLKNPLEPGATPIRDTISVLMEQFGNRRAVPGIQTDAAVACTTTVLKAPSGTVQKGDVLAFENSKGLLEAAVVTNINPTPTPHEITVYPEFSEIPGLSENIYQTEKTTPVDSGRPSATLLYLVDDYLEEGVGCLLGFGLKGEFAKLVMGSVEFVGGDWEEIKSTSLDAPQFDKDPIKYKGRAFFNGVALHLSSFEFSLGLEHQVPAFTDGYHPINTKRGATCKVTFRQTNTTVPQMTWQREGTRARFFLQIGNTPGNMVVITGMAMVGDALSKEEVQGVYARGCTFHFHDDQTSDPTPPTIHRG